MCWAVWNTKIQEQLTIYEYLRSCCLFTCKWNMLKHRILTLTTIPFNLGAHNHLYKQGCATKFDKIKEVEYFYMWLTTNSLHFFKPFSLIYETYSNFNLRIYVFESWLKMIWLFWIYNDCCFGWWILVKSRKC